MKKLLNFKRSILLIVRIMNLAVIAAIFAFVWYTFYSDPVLPGAATAFAGKGNYLLVVLYAVLLGSFTLLNGGYKVGDYRISEMIYANSISVAFINIIYYCIIALLWRAFPDVRYLIVMSIVQIGYVFIWSVVSNRFYFFIYKPRRVVYFYEGEVASIVLDKMNRRNDKYNVQEVMRIMGDIDFFEAIRGFDAVVLDRVNANLRERCIRACYASRKRLYMVPSFNDVIVESSMMINLLDTPLYLMKNRGLSFEQAILKRLMDLLICIPLFVIAVPFMIVTAIAIKLEDGGPVFYKQRRLTLHGKVFKILKFRSMHVDAESDGVAKLMEKNDQRITRVGAFIRKVRLDEVPQLLNVLRGDMSLIGPRPERPEIAHNYYQEMPEFIFRLNGKAGISGYAQVMGKYNTTPYDKLVFDLMYLENYSLLFDLKILLMTLKTVFNMHASEGVNEDGEGESDV